MAAPSRFRALVSSRSAVAAAALVCIGLLLVSVNIVANRFFAARADLTAERLYTLSPGTLRTLARIDWPEIRTCRPVRLLSLSNAPTSLAIMTG